METERRTILKVLSAGAIAPAGALRAAATLCSPTGVDSTFENYRFAFFTGAEQALVGRLMELIIPADEHSPGALAARVPAFADWMISTGSEKARAAWRSGLAAFRNASETVAPEAVLAAAASEEDSPKTDLGRFFVELKRMTVDGYYTSTIGIHQEMRYEGNAHLTAAPRCDHPEHGAG
ncbi:MAG: gluconate 2-dehydrogenase subunit 3 family protein [Acidobacteriota bacterium]